MEQLNQFSLISPKKTFAESLRMDPLVAAIDQGTSSTRFLVSDDDDEDDDAEVDDDVEVDG